MSQLDLLRASKEFGYINNNNVFVKVQNINLHVNENSQTDTNKDKRRPSPKFNYFNLSIPSNVEQMIRQLFFRSVIKSDYKIDKIETIHHDDTAVTLYSTIYKKYQKQYAYQGKDLERWLFHGTNTNLLKQIEKNGFDRSFNRLSLYGKVKCLINQFDMLNAYV